MDHPNCRSCKRPLRDPRSRGRGFGPVCWARTMSGEGAHQEGTNVILVADDPAAPGDVFFRALLDGSVETNVAPVSLRHSPTGYAWGYGGSGPADLALNILLRFVGPEEAWIHHQDFKWEFISRAPRQGARIKADSIRRWIDGRVAALREPLPVPAEKQ